MLMPNFYAFDHDPCIDLPAIGSRCRPSRWWVRAFSCQTVVRNVFSTTRSLLYRWSRCRQHIRPVRVYWVGVRKAGVVKQKEEATDRRSGR